VIQEVNQMRSKLASIRPVIIIIVGLIGFSYGCKKEGSTSSLISSSYGQMGTQWNISICTNDTISVQDDIKQAWRLLDTLNLVLSNFEEVSDVTQMSNHSGDSSWIPIHDYTLEVLEKSLLMHAASNGGFDITIAPVMKLWRRGFKTKEWPNANSISTARSLVGIQYLELDNVTSSARLLKEGMSIDLGGIGKGYAVDKLFEYLRKQGYTQVMVDGGGDIRIGMPPEDQEGWVIKSQTLNQAQQLVTNYDTLSNIAIATSGNRYQYIDNIGKRFQHHIDPNSGAAVSDIYQVSVISNECWKSDAISTAISILGADKVSLEDYRGYIIMGNDPYKMRYFEH